MNISVIVSVNEIVHRVQVYSVGILKSILGNVGM